MELCGTHAGGVQLGSEAVLDGESAAFLSLP